MKPDQHKKKRSAQYKRKHGNVPTKGATKVPSAKISGPASALPAVDSKPLTDGTNKFQGAVSCKIGATDQSLHDDEENEEVRLFSRRKIESNWSRYEPLKDDEGDDSYEGLKGADYRTLLNQTGDASSQFRFKAEQLWEEDERDADKEGVVQGFPAIDCHDLAHRLKAVPLNVRLNIESCFFEPSVLKNLKEAATRHQELLDRNPAKQTWASLRPDSELVGPNTGKMLWTNSDDINTAADQDDVLFDSEDEDTATEATLPAEDFKNLEDCLQLTDVHESRADQGDLCVKHIQSAMTELMTDGEVGIAKKLECPKDEKENKPVKTDLEFHVGSESPIAEKDKTKLKSRRDVTLNQPNDQTIATRITHQDVSQTFHRPVTKPRESSHVKLPVEPAGNEEEELDFLLSLENPMQTVMNGGLKARDKDNELTSLGGLERSSLSELQGGPVKSKQVPAAVNNTSSSAEVLEDWLDSLLDD